MQYQNTSGKKRNVIASPDRIVIGAGVGVLLNILAFLFDNNKTVSFPDKSFIQGIGIFESSGFNVHTRDKNADINLCIPITYDSLGRCNENEKALGACRILI